MYKPTGFETASAKTGDFETLPLGGHICIIKDAYCTKAEPGKNYIELLTIEFDIAEGEAKGYYERRYKDSIEKNPTGAKWQGKIWKTIKAEEDGYFKGWITVLEKSNNGFKFDFDEKKLIGKLFGGVFGEEEYLANDGSVKTSIKCRQQRSTEEIRKGIKIPDIKRLAGFDTKKAEFNAMQACADDELPF